MGFIKVTKGNSVKYIATDKIIAICDHEIYTDKWEFNVKETADDIFEKIKEANKTEQHHNCLSRED